jgi:hypothetical protein
MLRVEFAEPRIHFAINCASIGCPMLRDEAYTPLTLEQQLEEQTSLFLKDETRNSVDENGKKLKLSKIFSWFEIDFTKHGKSVAGFVLPYITGSNVEPSNKWKIDYYDYDWGLNE